MSAAPLLVIFNPAAARGRSGMRLRKLRKLLGGSAEFQSTAAPGHAEELAQVAASAGTPTIVAAGGDGTVHEVANGILRVPHSPSCFGVVPLGSGNDYADSLQLPRKLEQLCEVLTGNRSRAVDVGQVTDERGRTTFFVNTIGMGLGGAVTWESRQIHGLRGLALYGLATLRAIWKHFHAQALELTVDGERRNTPTLFFSIALGRREGGGFVIAPNAELDDGWFDFLHAGPMTRWQALSYMPKLIAGRIPKNDVLVHQGRCRRVSIESVQPLVVHTDGEMFATPTDVVHRLDIHIIPLRFRVRGPA